MVKETVFAGKWKQLHRRRRSKMNHSRIFKEFIHKSLEIKHRDMFKLLERENGHVVVVGDDDDDDVICCLSLRRWRTLLTPHHQSAQKRTRIEVWMFCRIAAAFSRKRFYFPDRRVEGQDHLEGSKRPDMYSAPWHMGTWNLVEISRAMIVILRQRTRPILK